MKKIFIVLGLMVAPMAWADPEPAKAADANTVCVPSAEKKCDCQVSATTTSGDTVATGGASGGGTSGATGTK